MSNELAVQALEAAEFGPKQQIAVLNQQMQAATQAAAAQRFEMGLTRASETAASTFEGLQDSARKSTETASSHAIKVQDIPQFELKPSFGSDNKLGEKFKDYMEGFNQRATQLPNEVNEYISGGGKSVDSVPSLEATEHGPQSNGGPLTPQGALELMRKSFEFRVETEVVTAVSRNTTKVINDLMKGQ
jgi:hypothetical protein